MMTLFTGCQDSLIGGDTFSADTIPRDGIGYAEGTTGIFQAKLRAIYRDAMGALLVLCLISVRQPVAIVWLVIAVVVTTLDGVLGRGLKAHIGKEVLELLPAIANENAARSILSESLVARVRAALGHTLPACILRGLQGITSAVSMFPKNVSPEASATSRGSTRETSCQDRFFRPAIASAHVNDGPARGPAVVYNHDKAPIPDAYFAIKKRSHGVIVVLFDISHERNMSHG